MRDVFGKLRRHFDLVVIAGLVAVAVLSGILNNLRVADERKVKWFGGPAEGVGEDAGEDEDS